MNHVLRHGNEPTSSRIDSCEEDDSQNNQSGRFVTDRQERHREMAEGKSEKACPSSFDPSLLPFLNPTPPEADPERLEILEKEAKGEFPPDDFEPELPSPPPSFEPLPKPVPLKLEITGVTAQKSQPEFWERREIHRLSIAAKLRSIGQTALAITLEECRTRITFVQCKGCNATRQFVNRCDLKECPSCQPRLARLRAETVEWWTREIDQPKHVVLTIKNTADLTTGHIQEFKRWLTRLRRRKFAQHWRGGFYSIECTNESRGWHLHAHLLIDARWIDAKQLAIEWGKVTNGAGHIVKVIDVRQKSYLHEVTKYACKGSAMAKWTPRQIGEFVTAFANQRTFAVFGKLYGKRTEWREFLDSLKTARTKCPCGCNDAWYFDANEWAAKFLVPNTPPRAGPHNAAAAGGLNQLGLAM